jgi:hypothetical protein
LAVSETIASTLRAICSSIADRRRGVNARETILRSRAWRGSSMLTIGRPKRTATHGGGSGEEAAGSLLNTLAFRLTSTTSACRTRAWKPPPGRRNGMWRSVT